VIILTALFWSVVIRLRCLLHEFHEFIKILSVFTKQIDGLAPPKYFSVYAPELVQYVQCL